MLKTCSAIRWSARRFRCGSRRVSGATKIRARRLAVAAGFAALALAAQGAAAEVRVVTLAPSLTEIAYAVGCGPKLVADTSYDNYPAGARTLPHVADLVAVDLERMSSLRPTGVIALQDQEREAAPIQSRLHVPVVYLPNRNLGDLFADIAGVGEVCAERAGATKLSSFLRARVNAIAKQAAHYRDHPRVLFLLDLPGFTAGSQSFLGDLIQLAGGINAAGTVRQAYPDLSSESLLAADPDVIIVARAAQFGLDIMAKEPWRSMRAVREGRVLRPPSDDILERDGPRIIQGLEWLTAAIHRHSP